MLPLDKCMSFSDGILSRYIKGRCRSSQPSEFQLICNKLIWRFQFENSSIGEEWDFDFWSSVLQFLKCLFEWRKGEDDCRSWDWNCLCGIWWLGNWDIVLYLCLKMRKLFNRVLCVLLLLWCRLYRMLKWLMLLGRMIWGLCHIQRWIPREGFLQFQEMNSISFLFDFCFLQCLFHTKNSWWRTRKREESFHSESWFLQCCLISQRLR